MNICFINPTKKLRKGMVNLIESLLEERGNKIYILTPLEVGNPFEDKKNIELIVYPSFFIPKIRYTIPNALKQYLILKKIIKQKKIDIIHCWSYFYPVNIIPLFLAKKYKIPIFTTLDSFPGINWFYGGSFLVDWFSSLYSKTIGKYVLRKMNKIILLGEYLVKYAKNLGILNCIVIPLSVDIKKFNLKPNEKLRNNLGIKENEVVLINVGRLVPVKKIETLIQLTKDLLKKDYKIKMLIVGDGPYEKKYKKMANEIEEIIFTGHREDIPELLSISHIFVLTSLSEGLPNCILEACAAGKPIISTNVGAVPELVEDSKSGYLTSNYEEILEKTEKLIIDSKLRAGFGKTSIDKMKKNYGTNEIKQRYKYLYKNQNVNNEP